RVKPIVEKMNRRLRFRLQSRRRRAIVGHGVVSTGAPTPALIWVSPPGDYAIVNSNHIPDGTRRCHYEGLRRPSFGLSGPSVSSHRTRVRKASQRFVSRKAFKTEETNQRFKQSRARVPSSNQWIITQPTPPPSGTKGAQSRQKASS